jgi:hypothetical protein
MSENDKAEKVINDAVKVNGVENIINDPVKIEWYGAGFRLAINYIYEILPEESWKQLTRQNFKKFLDDNLDLGVEENYFSGTNNIVSIEGGIEGYDLGWCPGPGGCVPCPDGRIQPTINKA